MNFGVLHNVCENVMKRIQWMFLAMTFAGLSVTAYAGNKNHDDDSSDDDSDDRGRSSICERTAGKMFKSCRFEVKEEFFATTAKCINFGDSDAKFLRSGKRFDVLDSFRGAERV